MQVRAASASDAGKKFVDVTPGRQAQFQAGVQGTTQDWAKNTVAAGASYAQGVQAGITGKRFEGGVAKAGTAKWKAQTLALGVDRWPVGVRASGDAYTQGVQPYFDAVKNADVPPRKPRGDPGNIQRVAAIADVQHKLRLAKQGS
jgi:hypothetical protein